MSPTTGTRNSFSIMFNLEAFAVARGGISEAHGEDPATTSLRCLMQCEGGMDEEHAGLLLFVVLSTMVPYIVVDS